MKVFVICFVFVVSSYTLSGQEVYEGKLTAHLNTLLQQRESVTMAYALYPDNKLCRTIQKLDRKIHKIKNSPEFISKTDEIGLHIEAGIRAYQNKLADSAVYYLRFLNDQKNLVYVKNDTVRLYQILSESYLKLGQTDSAMWAMENYIHFGGCNFISLVNLAAMMTSKNIDWHAYMDGMLRNFVLTSKTENLSLSLLLSLIEFNDQYPRSLSYGNLNILPLDCVYASDSINQMIFEQLFYIAPSLREDFAITTSKGFISVLMHSVGSDISFLEKYFHVYARSLQYRFSDFATLRFVFDLYLRETRNTQYFNAVQGTRVDGTFGTLPRESTDTVAKVMKFLKVEYNPAE